MGLAAEVAPKLEFLCARAPLVLVIPCVVTDTSSSPLILRILGVSENLGVELLGVAGLAAEFEPKVCSGHWPLILSLACFFKEADST